MASYDLHENHFDLPDGTVPTTSNTSSPGNNAVTSVTITNATMVASTAQRAHGTASLKITPPSSGSSSSTAKVSYSPPSSAGLTSAALRFYVYLTALPSVITNFANVYTDGSHNQVNCVNITSSGALSYTLSGGGGQTLSGFTFALNTLYRIESKVVIGTNGSVDTRVYAGDSTTVLAQLNPTGINTLGGDGSAAPITSVTVGKIGGSATFAGPFWLDDFAVQDGTLGFIGPYLPDAPSVIASSSLSGSTLQLGSVASTYDNAAPTYAWSQTAGPAVTLSSTSAAGPSAPLTAAGTYSFKVTVTDDLGKTASDTTTITYTGSQQAPALSGTQKTNQWVEIITGTPVVPGAAMSYTISPSTGVSQPAPGVFVGQTPTTATSYTVTGTEAGNANTQTFRFTVPGQATALGGLRILLASDDQSNGGAFS